MPLFHNGPADGLSLTLSRSPNFLRVCTLQGAVRTLESVSDAPESKEDVHVYKLLQGDYWLYPYQPMDHQMRNTFKWQQWCRDEVMRNKRCEEYGIPMKEWGQRSM